VAGEGVGIEAKAAAGVPKVDSASTEKGDSVAVGVTEGQESGEQAGGNAPRRRATTRCSGSQGG
jgi:hypothetical protein